MEQKLDKKIKLIWDFKGPAASKTAAHYDIHLQEYIANQELKFDTTGHVDISDMHSIAFMIVAEFEMIQARNDLKPHRGEIYQDA